MADIQQLLPTGTYQCKGVPPNSVAYQKVLVNGQNFSSLSLEDLKKIEDLPGVFEKLSLLRTPLEIYNVLAMHFSSDVQATVTVEQDSVKMTCIFRHTLPSLILNKAVATKEFFKACLHMQSAFDLRSTAFLDIKPERFSLDAISLGDWKKFRRVMYEKNGKSCVDAIVNFLQNPKNLETVTLLGFAPVQVNKNFTEADLEYFNQVIKCPKFGENLDILFPYFRMCYSKIYKQLAVNILLEYLRSDPHHIHANDYLVSLSLQIYRLKIAPSQIEDSPTRAIFGLFRGVLQKSTTLSTKDQVLSGFRTVYPKIYTQYSTLALFDYLAALQNSSIITLLGLTPDQVENDPTDTTLEIFRKVLLLTCQYPQLESTILLNFKTHFPKNYQRVGKLVRKMFLKI